MLANSGGFFNLSSKWVIEQWRQLTTSTTYFAQELLWMYSTVTAQKLFAKETRALKMRGAVASSQKRQRPTEGNPWSWSSYKLQKSCQRTQRGPFYGLLAFAIWKAENAWKVGASWADCKSNKWSFWSVIFSHSTQQQQTISWSGCDVGWKVYFIRQPAMTSSAGPRSSFKALPKAKLAPKRSWSLFGVYCPSDPLQLSESWWNQYIWEDAQQINEMHWTLHPAAGTGQQKGPNSSPRQCLTTCHTTDSSKVEWIGLQSFASSAILTQPLDNQLPLLQGSRQLFAGKMLPQPAGGRKCFPRVCRILKHRFLCYRNEQTYFLLAKMGWL